MEPQRPPSKHYSEFSPPSKPGTTFPLATAEVDPCDHQARRAHMVAFFKFMERFDDQMLAAAREDAVEVVSAVLKRRGLREVSQKLFEYLLDSSVWFNWWTYLRAAGQPSPAWPWKILPDGKDMSEGISTIYAAWLEANEPTKGPSATTNDMDQATADTHRLDLRPVNSSDRPLPQTTLPTRATPCGNCQSSTHSLDFCLFAPTGTIAGCPFCKVTTHCMEDCARFLESSPRDIVRLVVFGRARMPAWETKLHWFEYLHIFTGTFEFFRLDRNAVLGAPLPWSADFARSITSDQHDALRKQLDLDGNKDCLPEDPATRNMEAAFETFAKPMKHVWPYPSR